MPGRYLREGILTSASVNSLDAPAELFYRRLISVVDDHGRFDADPVLLKSYCYPRRPSVRPSDITLWLAACEKAGLIALYEAKGSRYLHLSKLGEARAKKSRYPDPPEYLASVSICKQLHTNAPLNDNDNDPGNDATTAVVAAAEPQTGEKPPLSDEDWLKSLCADPTYAGIDVRREHGKCLRWCEVKKLGMSRRRLVNWLNKVEVPMGKGGSPHVRKYEDKTL